MQPKAAVIALSVSAVLMIIGVVLKTMPPSPQHNDPVASQPAPVVPSPPVESAPPSPPAPSASSHEKASQVIEKARAKFGRNVENYIIELLTFSGLTMVNDSAEGQELFEAAISAYADAPQHTPDVPEPQLRYRVCSAVSGWFNTCKSVPGSEELLHRYVDVYEQRNASLTTDPSERWVFEAILSQFSQMQQNDKAIKFIQYDLAAKTRYNSVDYFSRRAAILAVCKLLIESGRLDQAEGIAKTLLTLVEAQNCQGDCVLAHAFLATVYNRQGKKADANTEFEKALAILNQISDPEQMKDAIGPFLLVCNDLGRLKDAQKVIEHFYETAASFGVSRRASLQYVSAAAEQLVSKEEQSGHVAESQALLEVLVKLADDKRYKSMWLSLLDQSCLKEAAAAKRAGKSSDSAKALARSERAWKESLKVQGVDALKAAQRQRMREQLMQCYGL